MPIEYVLLKGRPSPLSSCPRCGAEPFDPFLRGVVQSGWRRSLGYAYCALICSKCHEIVGREKPEPMWDNEIDTP